MSNETKWTQGPWFIAEGSVDFVYAINERGSNRFWTQIQTGGTLSAGCDEVAANAHLIAAAPELYAMLERMLEPYGREDVSDEQIEQLLAKARGE